MLKQISKFLSQAVSVILLLLLALGIGAFLCSNLEHKSYLIAFLVAAAFTADLLFFCRSARTDLLEAQRPRKLCLVLTAGCLIWHTMWILVLRVTPTVDAGTFWFVANTLATGEETGMYEYVALFPHIFGYSWFLSLFIRLFGDGELLAPFINVMLTTGSGVLVFLLCACWFGKKEAVFAYLLWILCPSKTLYNTMVYSEALYTNLLLLFIYIVSRLEEKYADSSLRSVLIAAVLGLFSALILRFLNAARPIAAVPIIALFIWILLLRQEKLTDKKTWLPLIVFSLALMVLYVPSGRVWNQFMAKKLGTEPSSTPGYSIYVGFNEESQGSYSDEDMDLLQDLVYGKGLSPTEAQEKMLDLAKERITEGNINFPRLLINKLATLLGNDEGGAYYAKEAISSIVYKVLTLLSNIFYYVLIQLVFIARIRGLRRDNGSCFQLVMLYVIGLTLAQMLVEVALRYHYSMIPMLIIIAASAFTRSSVKQ